MVDSTWGGGGGGGGGGGRSGGTGERGRNRERLREGGREEERVRAKCPLVPTPGVTESLAPTKPSPGPDTVRPVLTLRGRPESPRRGGLPQSPAHAALNCTQY